jgi:hypothetical protein
VTPTLSQPPDTQTATPGPTKTDGSFNISNFIYPGSSVQNRSDSDDTDAITEWYKNKIKSLGVNVKSFVTTKANDKVLNKLVGANSELEISVEISKDQGVSVARITVSLK